MNHRQRFHATMHYQPRDRSPILDFGFWDETIPIWHEQGLPKEVTFTYDDYNTDVAFGMDYGLDGISKAVDVNVGLFPEFDEITIKDLGDHEIRQQKDGVRVLRRKFMSSIPIDVDHLLVDRQSWEKHYKPRLDPNTPGRYPVDWEESRKIWCDPKRDFVVALPGGSLYGWLRNWIGMEAISYIVYDDPAWFEEMVTTIADCIIGTLTRVLETGGRFDGCGMWEDMCYSGGPLLSPRHFKKYLVPHYRRIVDLMHSYDIDVIWLDCDGNIDQLLPIWLDVGVNCMFPVEIGTWGADPVRYRKQYGKDLLMMGGFDKHVLARSKQDIEQEVYRLTPLVEEGGFIGFCDHRVPPDVPFVNYLFYCKTVRRVWGKGIDLPPAPLLSS